MRFTASVTSFIDRRGANAHLTERNKFQLINLSASTITNQTTSLRRITKTITSSYHAFSTDTQRPQIEKATTHPRCAYHESNRRDTTGFRACSVRAYMVCTGACPTPLLKARRCCLRFSISMLSCRGLRIAGRNDAWLLQKVG